MARRGGREMPMWHSMPYRLMPPSWVACHIGLPCHNGVRAGDGGPTGWTDHAFRCYYFHEDEARHIFRLRRAPDRRRWHSSGVPRPASVLRFLLGAETFPRRRAGCRCRRGETDPGDHKDRPYGVRCRAGVPTGGPRGGIFRCRRTRASPPLPGFPRRRSGLPPLRPPARGRRSSRPGRSRRGCAR